jgi:hypothetical protein
MDMDLAVHNTYIRKLTYSEHRKYTLNCFRFKFIYEAKKIPELYSWGCSCFARALSTNSFHFLDNE